MEIILGDNDQPAPDVLRELRVQARLSKAELGRRIGLSHVSIGRIERGVHQTSFDTLEKWVKECGFKVELRRRNDSRDS